MKIGAVLCARNEAHVIEEWVAHHLALGIERIHIFDHISTDATRHKIELIHAAVPSVTVETWNPPTDVQRLAYNRGLEIMAREDIDWCAFIDTDEFIANGNPATMDTLADMLARHSNHCAIGLHWAIFGSSGHIAAPEGLMQESFLHRAEESFSVNRHIKSIVRPQHTLEAAGAHGFKLNHPYVTVTGEEISWWIPFAYTHNNPNISDWRINHYFCQWRERWDAKIARSKVRGAGSVTRTEKDWIEHDRNEVFDPSALQWISDDKAMLARITRTPFSTEIAVETKAPDDVLALQKMAENLVAMRVCLEAMEIHPALQLTPAAYAQEIAAGMNLAQEDAAKGAAQAGMQLVDALHGLQEIVGPLHSQFARGRREYIFIVIAAILGFAVWWPLIWFAPQDFGHRLAATLTNEGAP